LLRLRRRRARVSSGGAAAPTDRRLLSKTSDQSISNGPKQDPHYAEPPLPLHGDADRYNHRDGADDYTQAGNLFRLFDTEQKRRLFDNIAAAMQGVPDEIKRRQIALFAKCDPAYGAGVVRAVKLVEPPVQLAATERSSEIRR
jgi:catalase